MLTIPHTADENISITLEDTHEIAAAAEAVRLGLRSHIDSEVYNLITVTVSYAGCSPITATCRHCADRDAVVPPYDLEIEKDNIIVQIERPLQVHDWLQRHAGKNKEEAQMVIELVDNRLTFELKDRSSARSFLRDHLKRTNPLTSDAELDRLVDNAEEGILMGELHKHQDASGTTE